MEKLIPMYSYVVVSLVININIDCITVIGSYSWSWKFSIHGQYAFCATQSCVIGFFHLQDQSIITYYYMHVLDTLLYKCIYIPNSFMQQF
jgi:hypothetical protein